MKISIRELCFYRNDTPVIKNFNAGFADRSITAVIGRNGSGKSTLLKLIAGVISPTQGKIFYGEKTLSSLPVKSLAQCRAILFQNPSAPPEMQVGELLKLARFAFDTGKKYDQQVIQKALADTGCTGLSGRKLGTLSGGELRRVFLAMALAQEPELLLLDEVEAGLDAEFCRQFPALLRKLAAERRLTVIMVMHDLDLALHCATDILGIADGKAALHTANTPDAVDQLNIFANGTMNFAAGNDGTISVKRNYLK